MVQVRQPTQQMRPICQTVLWPQDMLESYFSESSTHPVLVKFSLQGSRHGCLLHQGWITIS